jgi:hypothetical protein
MKTLLSLLATLSASSAFASSQPLVSGNPALEPMISAHQSPGFVMNPQDRDLTIYTNGQISLTIHDYRSNSSKTVELGQLSKDALAKIAADIAAIPASAKLVDDKEGQPMCTDTPSTSVSVRRADHQLEIYRDGSCHEWHLDSYSAREEKALALAFLNF